MFHIYFHSNYVHIILCQTFLVYFYPFEQKKEEDKYSIFYVKLTNDGWQYKPNTDIL